MRVLSCRIVVLFLTLVVLCVSPSVGLDAYIIDRVDYDLLTSGYGDVSKAVAFTADQEACSCGCGDINYTWHFGDGETANNDYATHVYDDGGPYNAYLFAQCSYCGAYDYDYVYPKMIESVEVPIIGVSDGLLYLCFDSDSRCVGRALPTSLGDDASKLIDWYMVLGWNNEKIQVPNKMDPSFSLPSWPTSNSSWGDKTLKASIGGTDVSGQSVDLMTGTGSDISTSDSVSIFYEATGTKHPGGYDPWNNKVRNNTYYYSLTGAHDGCTFRFAGSQCSPWDHVNNYIPYVGDLSNPYHVPDYTYQINGQTYAFVNGDDTLWGIDVYAWASRHEVKHHDDYSSWWGAGGVVSSLDQDEDRVPNSLEPNFPESKGGPYLTNTWYTHPWYGGYDDQAECMFTQEEWNVGSLLLIDWAHPGSQWH